ncbi:acetylornithine deacetylase [Lewinellaceae bacterium SD302]|nr:acetylornithine deacetylase [Lewinellaceae bacterium SD302]
MEAVELLKELIRTPSFSKEESATAELISAFFERKNIAVNRHGNNLWVTTANYRTELPTVLLNSHHDTVKPVSGWARDPFSPDIEDGKLYGLGSNDAGASLVSLATTFLNFYGRKDLPFNLIFLASAEEEISGAGGVASVLPQLGKVDFGIVGEPTEMQLAVAEKGLMVIDGLARGKAGHAARDEGENALYIALEDIDKLRNFSFPRISEQLGKVKVSVTQIEAGTQHNVVPDSCRFVVDVRTTEQYSNQEVADELQNLVTSRLIPRSLRLNSSGIPLEHPLVRAGIRLGRTAFGSSTLSDQALMPFPTLKMGPGHSNRSHTADEFIYLKEIEEGINLYTSLIDTYIQEDVPKKQTV